MQLWEVKLNYQQNVFDVEKRLTISQYVLFHPILLFINAILYEVNEVFRILTSCYVSFDFLLVINYRS